jgi:hypothetical protein
VIVDGTDAGAAVETTGGEQGQSGVDGGLMEHINSQFETFGQQINERLEALAPNPEPVAEPQDEWMERYGHLFEEPDGVETQPQQEAGDALARQALQELAQRDAARDQAMQELAQRLDAQELNRDADQLVEQYPELRDPAVARQVVEETAQVAARLGAPQLASSPWLAGLVYRASKADALAQSGVPAGGDAHVHLEGAGGAGPAPQDENVGQGIVNAMGGGSLWGR